MAHNTRPLDEYGSFPAWHCKPKLTAEQRSEIGYLKFEGARSIDLAVLFGVSRATVDNISKAERPNV